MSGAFADINVGLSGHVATVEIDRPPHNFFDRDLIAQIADAYGELDDNPRCRAIVLASNGKSFCAGANFGSGQNDQSASAEFTEEGFRNTTGLLYREGVRLFSAKKPIVAAVQGAAIGGGFGLALTADFRVAAHEARFAANFVKLGIHPGFGLNGDAAQPDRPAGSQPDVSYPAGASKATKRLGSAWSIDWCRWQKYATPPWHWPARSPKNAPLAVVSVRATMRQGLAEKVAAANRSRVGRTTMAARHRGRRRRDPRRRAAACWRFQGPIRVLR